MQLPQNKNRSFDVQTALLRGGRQDCRILGIQSREEIRSLMKLQPWECRARKQARRSNIGYGTPWRNEISHESTTTGMLRSTDKCVWSCQCSTTLVWRIQISTYPPQLRDVALGPVSLCTSEASEGAGQWHSWDRRDSCWRWFGGRRSTFEETKAKLEQRYLFGSKMEDWLYLHRFLSG